jgi:hypothetical protein
LRKLRRGIAGRAGARPAVPASVPEAPATVRVDVMI